MRELNEIEKSIDETWAPIEYRILVLMEEAQEFADEGKFIQKPEKTREREQFSQVVGRVVALGGNAFVLPDGDMMKPTPKIGDRVLLNKHSGMPILGVLWPTGKTIGPEGAKKEEMKHLDVRVCNDKDINAIIKTEEKVIKIGGMK